MNILQEARELAQRLKKNYVAPAVDLAKTYYEGRIKKPYEYAKQAETSPSKLERYVAGPLSAAYAGFSMTPVGWGANLAEAGLTSLLESARTTPKTAPAFGGVPNLGSTFKKNLGDYTTGVASTGLGATGPAAFAGDVLFDPDSLAGMGVKLFDDVSSAAKHSPDLGGKLLGQALDADLAKTKTKTGLLKNMFFGDDRPLKPDKKAAREQIKFLQDYSNELSLRGYAPEQINRISANEARKIFAEDIPPFSHPTFEAVTKYKKPPEIFADEQTQQVALTASAMSEGKFNNFSDDLKDAWRTWVHHRQASKLQGFFKRGEFADLDKDGFRGITRFQEGFKQGRYQDVKKYFDSKYKQAIGSGLEMKYRQHYLPQLWLNKQAEVEQVFRKLGLKPGFTMDRVFETYKEGIAAGLKPRYQTVGELAGWYDQRINKAIADQDFFRYLSKEGLIQPSGKVGAGWVTIAPDNFPKFKARVGGKTYMGTYSAPEELGKMINNYLVQPEGPMAQLANFASLVKNIALTTGIPKTGVNFHGLNVAVRNILSAPNPIKALADDVKYLTMPRKAGEDLIKNQPKAVFAAKHGLRISGEEHAVDALKVDISGLMPKVKGKFNRYLEIQQELFDKPLFNQIIPAMKVKRWDDIYQDLIKRGVDQKTAARQAAEVTNNIFGGINYEELGKDRNWQNWIRVALLAPDWLQTQFNLAKGVVKGAVKWGAPELKTYRTILRNLAGFYLSASLTNKMLNGKWMHENDAGNQFNVQLGSDNEGNARYVRPFGTAVDFLRIPMDIASALMQGDPSVLLRTLRNRLSIPAGTALGLIANVDYRGNPIYGQDRYGNKMSPTQSAVGIGGELSRLVTPPYVKAVADYGRGSINEEQFISQLLELPTRYQSPYSIRYSIEERFKKAILNKDMQELEELGPFLTKYSVNQKTLVADALAEAFTKNEKLYNELYPLAREYGIKDEQISTRIKTKSYNYQQRRRMIEKLGRAYVKEDFEQYNQLYKEAQNMGVKDDAIAEYIKMIQ